MTAKQRAAYALARHTPKDCPNPVVRANANEALRRYIIATVR